MRTLTAEQVGAERLRVLLRDSGIYGNYLGTLNDEQILDFAKKRLGNTYTISSDHSWPPGGHEDE